VPLLAARFLGDLGVDWVPAQRRQQPPRLLLFARAHASEHLQPRDLAGLQRPLSAFSLQHLGRLLPAAQVVDQH